MTTAELHVTLGTGRDRPRGRRVALDGSPVASLARVIGEHGGPEAWWAAGTFRDNYRHGENWQTSSGFPIDIDCHDATGKHAPIPADVAEHAENAIRGMSAPPNLLHRTPRGLRAVFVLAAPLSDAEAFASLARACAARLAAALGALVRRQGGAGLEVDSSVTTDRVHFLWTPNATVDGKPRAAKVEILRDEPYAYEDLAGEDAPLPQETTTKAAPRVPSPKPSCAAAPLAIPEGTRNGTLFRAACALQAKALSPEALRAALDAENLAKCVPPLAAAEVERIAKSAARYSQAETADSFVARVAAGLGDTPGADAVEGFARLIGDAAKSGDAIRRQALRLAASSALNARGVQGACKILDAALGRCPAEAAEDGRQGSAITFEAPEPWPDSVDGAALLAEIEAAFRRHVVMPEWARPLLALWVMHTWCFEAADFTARVFFTSAEKGSGKSRALAVLSALAGRVLPTAGITAAALFRTVAAHRPTLAVDECDTFLRDNEELRGVLNAGFERGGAVVRCVGDDAEPRRFDCFAPVALAGIGRLPGTVEDRAILVPMQRRLPSEKVAPFRREARAALADVRRRCARWAADNLDALKGAVPDVPDALDDRAADILGPLIAIADLAGGEWPARARAAAVEGLAGRRDEDQSTGTKLLADIRAILDARGSDRIATDALIDALIALDERPWGDYRRGKPINPRALARMLKDYGVKSGTIRLPDGTAKGYALAAFGSAFARYLPSAPEKPRSNTSQRHNVDTQGLTPETIRHKQNLVTDEKRRNPLESKACDVVTDRKPKNGAAAGAWRCPSCRGDARVEIRSGEWRCLHCSPPTEPAGPPTPSDAMTDEEFERVERECIEAEGCGSAEDAEVL